jgi:transglutaminase-like putative cysteine protease
MRGSATCYEMAGYTTAGNLAELSIRQCALRDQITRPPLWRHRNVASRPDLAALHHGVDVALRLCLVDALHLPGSGRHAEFRRYAHTDLLELPVTALKIHHKTIYHFRQSVSLGAHRLMLRPRESRDLRVMSHTLTITPAATPTWAHDVFGNAVATATFAAMTDMLVIDSLADILLDAAPWPIFDIAASAISYPFRYSDDEWTDLGALAVVQYPDQAARLRIWARGFIHSNPTDTLSLLKDLSLGVARIGYQSREIEGTQSPTETLDRGSGSCRDFALLFAEAARSLGFGARVVSGYLHNPNQDRAGSTGAGSTHAWAEVYVPGAGWITFDPTNRSVGGFNLIPVAVARDIRQAMPVSGSFVGSTDAFTGMEVEVSVTP